MQKKTLLTKCKYFTVYEYKINGACYLNVSQLSFQSLVFVEGDGFIKWSGNEISFHCGDTFFLPATMGLYEICGYTTVLVIEV